MPFPFCAAFTCLAIMKCCSIRKEASLLLSCSHDDFISRTLFRRFSSTASQLHESLNRFSHEYFLAIPSSQQQLTRKPSLYRSGYKLEAADTVSRRHCYSSGVNIAVFPSSQFVFMCCLIRNGRPWYPSVSPGSR